MKGNRLNQETKIGSVLDKLFLIVFFIASVSIVMKGVWLYNNTNLKVTGTIMMIGGFLGVGFTYMIAQLNQIIKEMI